MRLHPLPALFAAALLAACATSPTGRPQLMMVSDDTMSQMGLTAFNTMRQQGKFVDAPRERAYASCVANALIAVLPPPWNAQQWEVQIVGDDSANAFALPGGRIGVNRGMFKIATDQNQLAAVLAGTAYAASRGNDAGYAAAALGAGAELGILLPFSRTQESEADELGLRTMARAGFDPRAAATLWTKMEQQGGAKVPAFLSTHPSPAHRAQTLAAEAQTL